MRQIQAFAEAARSIASARSADFLDPLTSPGLAIQRDPHKGLVLVARKQFEVGQIISSAAAIELSPAERLLLKQHVVYRYVFINPHDVAARRAQPKGYLVFGPVSFCSHSDDPNAAVRWSFDGALVLVRLVAVEQITAESEVTMSYANLEEYPDSSNWV